MKYFSPLLPFIAGWLLLVASQSFSALSLVNGFLQLVLFAFVVCLPIALTGRLSYVDIGWPWGLVLIGVLTFLFAEGETIRVALVSMAYIFAGGRMGIGAVKMWQTGFLKRELPRYEYQKKRWLAAGKTNQKLTMQIEGVLQGLANASFLAMPAFIIASNTSTTVSPLEVIGAVIWLAAFIMESVADKQKHTFLLAMKQSGERHRVCSVGLWRYSRHPNYFAEWMVWNGLIIASLPAWWALYQQESPLIGLLLGLGLIYLSRIMYTTLVYYTGAVPAEYYSAQKRPEYKAYQATTNRFFPWPKKVKRRLS